METKEKKIGISWRTEECSNGGVIVVFDNGNEKHPQRLQILDKETADFIVQAGQESSRSGLTPPQMIERIKQLEEALIKIDDRLSFLDKGVNKAGNVQISSAWAIAHEALSK